MLKAEVIAFHGWGFDSSCWSKWQNKLGEQVRFNCAERGYFGKPKNTPMFVEKETRKIVFAHSFGLHLCTENLFRQADFLIIFGGFLYFHPVATQYKRRSKLMLNQMMNRLQGNADKVLQEFYKNAYQPQKPGKLPAGDPQKERLKKDLKELNTSEVLLLEMKSIDKICILQGCEDTIVPRRKGRELYNSFPRRAQYFEIKNAGHALPFTHTDQCWQFLEPELAEIVS